MDGNKRDHTNKLRPWVYDCHVRKKVGKNKTSGHMIQGRQDKSESTAKI